MSTLSKYYEGNLKENPYTMEETKFSSRVAYLKSYITEHTPVGGTILDVGCGDMFLAKELPQFNWTGVDINTDVNNSSAFKHDLESFPYPFKKGQFDTIICSEVLEHLFDPVKVTKEIRRLVKPSGVYIVSTPNFDWIDHFVTHFRELRFDPRKSWTKEHIHQYNLQSHSEILKEADFSVIHYTGADAHFGHFMNEPRKAMHAWLTSNFGWDKDKAQLQMDILLGNMFRLFSHTIMIVAKPIPSPHP